MTKTLYVTDLDGTLLSTDATLSVEAATLLASQTARGALITCATARTPATVQPLMAPARLSVPAIVMTGAALWTINDERPHFECAHYMSESDARTLDRLFTESEVSAFIYTLPHTQPAPLIELYHTGTSLSRLEEAFLRPRRDLPLKHFNPGLLPPRRDDRVLYFALGDSNRIKTLADKIATETDCAYSCYPDNYNRGVQLLEVFAPGVSKAAAIARLRHRLGVDRLVVFGDNLNDLPMMAVADLAVAAPGALDQVKAKADIVLNASDAPVPEFIAADFASRH